MKKIVVFTGPILLMLLFTLDVFAQQGQGGPGRGYNMDPKEMAERQTNQMKETLSLTADQLPKVEALNLKYAEKMKVARDETDGDRESMRSTMMAMGKEKDIELKNILTAEQHTKWQEWRKEAREKGRQRRGI
ncbi:MAG: hypothetical protein KAI29_19210 [Cyclobacteriaceae bacterium]|nr:hypothetical protein [Cyclobacteriaceae bacterium]MCK5703301.1 hypothetical protein [Cyclobacteriaceae bacterium]